MKATRFTKDCGVKIGRDALGYWRHWDCQHPMNRAAVGPKYQTEAELLADHEAYLRRAGWIADN